MEQLILNLVPGGVSPVCYVSQYDVGRKIRLHLRNGSDPYVLSGAETVTATIRKVSGEELIYDIANTSASYVDMIVNYDATDVIGESVCELIITQSGIRLGSANFKMRIDPDVYSGDQKLEVVSATSETPDLSFETNVEENLLELKAGFSPVQDLHGYDSPWIDSNIVNKVPYIKRAVAGTATRIGNHLYDKLVGGTVAFNQLVQYENVAKQGLTATMDTNGVVSVSGTSSAAWSNITYGIEPIDNHKYFIGRTIIANPNNISLYWGFLNVNQTPKNPELASSGSSYNIVNINSHTGQSTGIANFASGTDFTGFKFKLVCIDLTAMFGSTIADYIYGLEQATAGAGVAWFKALFPNDYYAYNAGELMSVKATAHVMKNASNQVIGNYALDSNLELRGLFKLDANNKLYADGDTYESSGAVARKYGFVDLGSLNWEYDSVRLSMATTSQLTTAKQGSPGAKYNMLCYKYVTDSSSNVETRTANKTISLSRNKYIRVYDTDAGTDANAFKTAISGVYLLYELATPTTEQASPFTNPQVCDENGTEEYVDSRAVAIPVGHETYQANICEITGFDELNVVRTGVNLWDEEWEVGAIDISIGVAYGGRNQIRSKNFCSIVPDKDYYLYSSKTDGGSQNRYYIAILFYDENKNYISYIYSNRLTFTAPSGAKYFKITTNSSTVVYGPTYNNDISINYPATDTQYHPYTGKLINLDWNTNQWDEELEIGEIDANTGAPISDSTHMRSKNYTPCFSSKEYFCIDPTSNYNIMIFFYDKNKNYMSRTSWLGSQTFVTPENACYLKFKMGSQYGTTYNHDISINYPSTDHTYHPYKGHGVAYTGEVVYKDGGWKLRLLSKEVDLGDLTWYPGACALENKKAMRSESIANLVLAPPTSSIIVDILCSIYPTKTGDQTYLGTTGISILRGGTLAVFDDRYSTIESANAFKSAMAGVKLVYPLETPIEIPLDQNSKLATVLGINNLMHDANGGTEVKFFRMISAS